MENWEFLLQRKGDKSWLPLESPTVEILEGQYRLAARSDLANVSVGIAIAYRPIADVRHQPFQQKVVKRLSHDGLLIVMPYTNFVPGLWEIECLSVSSDLPTDVTSVGKSENVKDMPSWKKTVKFDVIPISSEFGSEWQYSAPEEDVETYAEIPTDIHTNSLGIEQTEPTPLIHSSPILDIAEQRSTELVQSMFEEFALFNDEIENENDDLELDNQRELTSDRLNLSELVSSEPLSIDETSDAQGESALQPRILLRLQQPQYVVNEDNSFNLVGEAYTKGEIEVSLKDPQTLELVVNKRYPIVRLGDRNNEIGAIPFTYQVNVPPPSQIQVLIGEVQIHPKKDFQQYDDLFVTQQAIAVSYPASRVLPEMLKEAQKYQNSDGSEADKLSSEEAISSSSYPQSPQGFPQVVKVAENFVTEIAPKPKVFRPLSLPPLPSKKSKAPEVLPEESQYLINSVSLPPLPPLKKRKFEQPVSLQNLPISEDYSQTFPQVEVDELQKIEIEFALTDLLKSNSGNDISSSSSVNEDEPELFYSFEEELPHNYEELLDQPKLETLRGQTLPSFNQATSKAHGRSNRFLNKLQTLSSEAISAQKASQRNEEVLLDKFVPNNSLSASEDLASLSVDGNNLEQPLTIIEKNSLAELDLELDLELDRLLAPDFPDLILNEYVWGNSIDPNSFPVSGLNSNTSASTLSETAQTIRNLQESSPKSLSEQKLVPVPELIVPFGEIVSGTPMTVIVRLPAIAPKFFVKFWIKDLQTRTIIDGPRWLLDFSVVPNTELIETRTNISIPLSSIDVAFEAIAIEAQTQRESHKVRVTRAVTPPNLVQDINYE
jgi:hypothetical protein